MNAIRRFSATSLSLVSSLSILVAGIPANAVTLVAQGSTVEGKTIGKWTANWWQWAFGQSTPNDAFTDTTGANAGVNQEGPVFFVAGTAGGDATRSFTVPGDKYLLIPMVNVSTSELDPCFLSDDSGNPLAPDVCVTAIADKFDSAFLEINGTSVIGDSNFDNYREASPLFNYVAVPDNPLGTATALGFGAFFKKKLSSKV